MFELKAEPCKIKTFDPVHIRTFNQAAQLLYSEIELDAFLETNRCSNGFQSAEVIDLQEEFWITLAAGPSNYPHRFVFLEPEQQFYRFDTSKGIYVKADQRRLLDFFRSSITAVARFAPVRSNVQSLLNQTHPKRLEELVEAAKPRLAVENEFFLDHQPAYLNLQNGVLNLKTNQFTNSSIDLPFRSHLNAQYDSTAQCSIFKTIFLDRCLTREDQKIVQLYLSQLLTGQNHSQRILILSGASGWGKSTLMNLMIEILGHERTGIVRQQVFEESDEVAQYQDKHLLYHPDLPTEFLNRPECSLFKQLVGGDPIWSDTKGKPIIVQGHFPIVLNCNGRPKIHIDQDKQSWKRRLAVVEFQEPEGSKRLGDLTGAMERHAQLSGILNWLVEGLQKLKLASYQLPLTERHQEAIESVLMASDPAKAFIENQVEIDAKAMITGADLYDGYLSWCRDHQCEPVEFRAFLEAGRTELKIRYGVSYRHDLPGSNGKEQRGWRGIRLKT